MSIADRIKSRVDRRSTVSVPEWGEKDEPEVIYFGPLLARELDQIQRRHNNFLADPSLQGMVDLIILKAQDEDGNKIFNPSHKPTLMREEVQIISRVAAEMLSTEGSPEELGND
jgi:phage I-like protein